jgi:glyoxylase-like metal-dependent hydrolase (beta-lactamase superfamily II)
VEAAYPSHDDILVLPHHEPAGAFGFLPCHSYLIKGREPILVDTGIVTETESMVDAVRRQIDLEDLRWIFLTHEDLDHAGAVAPLMQAAPDARLVLSFLALSKGGAGEAGGLMDRLVIATPGQSLVAGDRRFGVIRPPVYDSSATVAFFDEETRTLFSADAFGGVVPRVATDIEELGAAYEEGCAMFTLANSVWIHDVDPARLARSIDVVRTLAPDTVLSAHAVPLRGRTGALCDQLQAMPAMPPAVLPDNAAFQATVAQMKAAGGPPCEEPPA